MSLLNSKNVLVCGIIAFLAMSFWSLFSMPTDMNGNMINCPFMEHSSSFCQMSIFEHISAWQRFFAMIEAKNFISLFIIVITISLGLFIIKEWEEAQYQRFRKYLYRYRPEIKFFDYLLLIFSQGIIKPKIYESASI